MRASISLLTLALAISMGSACSSEPKPAAKPPAPPPPPKPPPTVSVPDLPPRHEVKGEGITLTELGDGRVQVETTAIWKAAIKTTYDDCTYYRDAVPVLERQIAPERAKLLYDMCGMERPLPGAAKRAKGGKLPKGAKAPKAAVPKERTGVQPSAPAGGLTPAAAGG